MLFSLVNFVFVESIYPLANGNLLGFWVDDPIFGDGSGSVFGVFVAVLEF